MTEGKFCKSELSKVKNNRHWYIMETILIAIITCYERSPLPSHESRYSVHCKQCQFGKLSPKRSQNEAAVMNPTFLFPFWLFAIFAPCKSKTNRLYGKIGLYLCLKEDWVGLRGPCLENFIRCPVADDPCIFVSVVTSFTFFLLSTLRKREHGPHNSRFHIKLLETRKIS